MYEDAILHTAISKTAPHTRDVEVKLRLQNVRLGNLLV